VFHFDAFWPHDASKLLAALRYGMPPAIAIRKICRVEQNFHARFSARAKRYIYRIKLGAADPFCFRWRWHIHRNIFDKEAMARAAVAFMGTHSFGAFANQRGNDEPQKSLRSIHRSQIKVRGNDIIYLTEGNGYLYKMVRRMVGAMVEVASGRRTVQHIVEALANGVSFPSFPSAPASGLTLERVFY
jgi:tRNA pseudouridine38-40 synthase